MQMIAYRDRLSKHLMIQTYYKRFECLTELATKVVDVIEFC